ncbi:MAG: WD40/YVTN/BNR-like repeat-containing protein [Acidimicrobiales bacterium]
MIEDVPGLVPFSQSVDGSDRGEGIDRSTDGGRTWTFSAVPPGCLQTCGPISVSFIDAEHGYAEASPQKGDSRLFATDDGGSTWLPVASMPNLGSVLVGGPIAQPQLLFTSKLDGWALTGPSGYGRQGQFTSPGGALYRTTNGGFSWTKAPNLPAGLQYTLPVFFGTNQGAVLAMRNTQSDHGTSVYMTDNGGATWVRHPLPTFPYVEFEPGNLQTRFAVVGPLSWRVDVGSALYLTNNGGRSWTTITPSPQFAPGSVHSLAFSSPHNGMAIGQPLRCSTPSTFVSCFPTLLVTADGGHHWRAEQF